MAKRKTIPKSIKRVSSSSLYRETEKQLREVEKRLKKLEKGVDLNKGVYNPKTKRYERKGTYKIRTETGEYITMRPTKRITYRTDSWAGKKLNEKLTTIKGFDVKKFKIPKKISATDLKALNKIFTNFLKSQTSTIRGIRDVEETTRQGIKNLVSDIDNLDNEDIETLYSFFNDKDFNYITQYIDPSELMVLIAETRSEGGTSDDFLRKIENYIYSESIYQDEDLVDSLESIYNKF